MTNCAIGRAGVVARVDGGDLIGPGRSRDQSRIVRPSIVQIDEREREKDHGIGETSDAPASDLEGKIDARKQSGK